MTTNGYRQQLADSIRDDIHTLTGAHGLLRRVHDDSYAPPSTPPEVPVTTSRTHPIPRPSDPSGVASYKLACRELAHVWQHGIAQLHPDTQLPAWMTSRHTPTPHQADQAARGLLPWVDDLAELRSSERRRGGHRSRGGVLLAVKRSRELLESVSGVTPAQQQPPMCRTPGCQDRSQPGERRRCRSCVDHRERTGSYPTRAA